MSSTGDHNIAKHEGSSSMDGSGTGTSGQSGDVGGSSGHGHGGSTDSDISNNSNDQLFTSPGGSSNLYTFILLSFKIL